MSAWLIYVLCLVALVGVVLCWCQAQQASKQQQTGKRLVFVIFSVLMLLGVYFSLQHIVGTEYAVFLSLFHFSWLAWIVIGSQSRVKIKVNSTKTVSGVAAEKSRWYKFAVVLLAGPVALFCSILSALLLSRWLVTELANQWVLTFMLVPLLWGGMATWFAADRLLYRPLIVTLLISGLAYGWLV